MAGLRDSRIQDWVGIHREHLLDMTFVDFLAEFKLAYLPKDWEEITRIELLQLMQGEIPFWDFSVKVQAKNSVLSGTKSHLDKTQLRHRIESGMDAKLALCCCLEKIGSEGTLAEWLDDMSCVDNLFRTERANFDALTKSSRENSRRNNAFAKPSHHVNTNTNTSSTNCIALPKLTAVEHQLLYDNNGCLKCQCVFVPHRSTDCPNDFPDAVNYKPLTQSFVKLIKKRVKKSVAAVANSSNDDDTSTSSAPAPVAVVMGMMSNPTAYTAANLMSVIEGDSFSDDSVSPLRSESTVQSVPSTTHASSVLTAPHEDMAPLSVPHLYWKCSASGTEFPVTFEALLDHGADTVFISEHFVSELSLKQQKLYNQMSVEMAMPGEGKKQVIHMSHWVKLQLHDPSGGWKSKSIRAVVALSLCSPVILGLPFLSHNKIVIDHDVRTAIAKDSGFDLLHPTTPQLKPAPKKKLK